MEGTGKENSGERARRRDILKVLDSSLRDYAAPVIEMNEACGKSSEGV